MACPSLRRYAATMTISMTEDLSRPSPNHRKFNVDFNGTPAATTALPSSPPLPPSSGNGSKPLSTSTSASAASSLDSAFSGALTYTPARTHRRQPSRSSSASVASSSSSFTWKPSPDSSATFVGMWNHSDADKLLNSTHELDMLREPLELRLYAGSKYTGRSLAGETIVEEYLGYKGVEFDRRISRSEWDDEELRRDQVLHACADAYASFLIGKDLRAWEL